MDEHKDPLWYKDAVIYQTHVKAFFDANEDGVGDIDGLIRKLDYVQELGASAIWLLPFYPSPLRDDGYDISDYRSINPSYGSMADVRRLIAEAHRRGLKVITELVINHTSDQHPWFQRARRAKPGSRYRDYYVWSDDDTQYADTRIIFLDTEKSNWTWDQEAKAYYWHRFYSHQPDLNFDNPRVLREVINLLHFWLRLGIDGLRLDAVPYLIEREGTNCENLPETHDILRRIRHEMDAHFADRMLLAEANQWPEDTRPYFGEGDECHMAFHFPLMPRMYMAIAQEDRHPITDIIRQTPEIPDTAQWAIFLRNHDELTLEMVTDNEREYLWNTYAFDRRMRINLGIRRRLAPLMDNDRRRIELMNGLLFSMPGTPVIYYGDEIGMGDNVYLGDRDGVRTPMQWSPDRNGGFSRAMPQRLFLPPNNDPIYGFDAVNVEAQSQSPFSLLNWMKRMIGIRKAHKAFGRGALNFIYPTNRKILAYTREYDGTAILCVFNLSRNAQAFELDLGRFRDRVLVELLGRTEFPPVSEGLYRLTMPGFGFYWFVISEASDAPSWQEPVPEPLPEFATIVLRGSLEATLEGRGGRDLVEHVLPEYLPKQRWFAAKGRRIEALSMPMVTSFEGRAEEFVLTDIAVQVEGGEAQRYLLPFAVGWGEDHLAHHAPLLPFTISKIRRGPQVGIIHDATHSDAFVRQLVHAMHEGRDIPVHGGGHLACTHGSRPQEIEIGEDGEIRRFGVEQSNTTVLVENRVIVKAYRRLHPGIHPELEIGHFLTEVAHYEATPPLFGAIERVDRQGERTAIAAAFGFVANQGDGWRWTLDYLDRALEDIRFTSDPEDGRMRHESYLSLVRLLGRRTGELHRAFAIDTDDPAFAREAVTVEDLQRWTAEARQQVHDGFATMERVRPRANEVLKELIDRAMAARSEVEAAIDALEEVPAGLAKTRLHGDYHLGQVLVAKADFMLLDFEGEPLKSLDERRAKSSPMRDVAGMLRSFDYAAWAGLFRFAESDPSAMDALLQPALNWRDQARGAFLDGYREAIGDCPSWPSTADAQDTLIRLFLIEKLFYEVEYEAAQRPTWLRIPINGICDLFARTDREISDGDD